MTASGEHPPDPPTAPEAGKRVVSGGLWGLAGKAWWAFAVLATNALLARLLTIEEMGAYTLLLSVVNVASLCAMLGLPQAVVRRTAEFMELEQHGRVRWTVTSAFRRTAWAGAAAAVLCGLGGGSLLLSGLLGMPQASALNWGTGLWIMVLSWQGVQSAVFRGFGDIRDSVLTGGALHSLLYVAALFLLWFLAGRATLALIVSCCVTAGFLSFWAGHLLLKGKLGRLGGETTSSPGLASDSLGFLVVSLTTAVFLQADIWIVSAFRPAGDVARYGAALRMSQTIPFFLLIANAALAPMIAEFRVRGRIKELEPVLRKVAGLAFVPAFFLALVFIFLGGPLLGMLFGGQYRDAARILIPLSLGQLFNVWSGPCGLALLMSGAQGRIAAVTAASALASVGASLLLVGDWGIEGVALASSGGLVLQSIMKLFLVRRGLGIGTHPRLRDFSSGSRVAPAGAGARLRGSA